jgi:hypothetical protein
MVVDTYWAKFEFFSQEKPDLQNSDDSPSMFYGYRACSDSIFLYRCPWLFQTPQEARRHATDMLCRWMCNVVERGDG